MAMADETPKDEPAPADGLAEAASPFAGISADTAPAPIVAIGASAGGLEAIEQFFAAIPVPSPFAFVIIQHLSPDFKNLMVELLARRTPLAVRAVEDGMAPEANAIHLIPPARTMTIEGGLLRLAERNQRDLVHHPIDEFFVSLATDRGAGAIAVVLSGSGSDGSRGARAIRHRGGRVLVQLPATAKFSSMPQSTLEAGCTDEVLAPSAMAKALLEGGPAPPAESRPDDLPVRLVECLDQSFGLDFSAYKNETVQRRVQRRMMLRGFDQLEAYADFVADDEAEQEALYQDLLIGVTSFFRDPDAIEALESHVVPDLASRLDAGEEVRLWVPACATGEEAYSLAILVLARCRKPLEALQLKIFATDVHRRSLTVASAGFYSEEAVANVRSEWLRRYFSRRGSGYQVIPAVRRVIVFSPHDLLRDAPFTRLSLLSCRNFLIHLQREAQTAVVAGFATALEPGGHLLLGASESLAGNDASFIAVDQAARLFRRRKSEPSPDSRDGDRGSAVAALAANGRELTVAAGGSTARDRRDQRLTMALELLLDRYVPPSLLVDENGQVVHCFGDAGDWLKAPRGRPSLAVLDMVKDELRAPLASAITRVKRTGLPITLARLALGDPAHRTRLERLVVEVPATPQKGRRCLLVSFDNRPSHGEPAAAADAALDAADDDATEPGAGELSRTQTLERDLSIAEESLKSTILDLEAANQELQSANQELVATNEEMHQAGIEHQRKIEALEELGQDLDNLLASTAQATLLVDADLVVRRFTPALADYVNLLAQDIGRPLAQVTHRFTLADLAGLLQAVIDQGEPAAHDLATIDGRIARLSVTPCKAPSTTGPDPITGLIVTIQDVTEALKSEARLAILEQALAHLIASTAEPTALAEASGPGQTFTVTAASAAMEERSEAPLEGRPLTDLLRELTPDAEGRPAAGPSLDTLATDPPASLAWTLPTGQSLTLETLQSGAARLAILRLTLPSTPAKP